MVVDNNMILKETDGDDDEDDYGSCIQTYKWKDLSQSFLMTHGWLKKKFLGDKPPYKKRFCLFRDNLPVIVKRYDSKEEVEILLMLQAHPSISGIPELIGITEHPQCLIMLDYMGENGRTFQ